MKEAFMDKGLTTNAEKLLLVDKLSNVLHVAVKNDVVKIAYLIHEIVGMQEITTEARDEVAKWQITYK